MHGWVALFSRIGRVRPRNIGAPARRSVQIGDKCKSPLAIPTFFHSTAFR
jgi:hypothetical protein